MVADVLVAVVEPPNSVEGVADVEAEACVLGCRLKLGNAVVVVDGVVAVTAADADELVIVVVVAVTAADDEADGGTVRLKPKEEEAGAENNDPDVAGEAVADGTVDALVAETEAPKRELAGELAAAPVLENIEGADAACEVAKEKPLAGADASVEGAADALLENEKAEAAGADENREEVVLAVVVLPDDGVKPNEGAEAVVAGDNGKTRDGVAVVAVVAGDEAPVLPNKGAVELDPNKDEPVVPPNPRAGAEAEVVAVLDAAGALLKPNFGVGAVVAPDADEPKPVAAPEKRPGVDAAEGTAPNRLEAVAAPVFEPKRPGVAAGVGVAPKRLGLVAADEVAGAPKMLGVFVVVPNRVGVIAAAEVVDAPKRGEADEVVG
jgi:hypothetical protein